MSNSIYSREDFVPVVLFVYARLDHTKKVIESLLDNSEAAETRLIIFSDGPKSNEKKECVEDVRGYLRKISGFKEVEIHERQFNLGLSTSIIQGVSDCLRIYESIIVLEDDIVVSKYFLRFMNEALVKYRDDPRVFSVHGYVYPVSRQLPQTFFLKGADCWGWGCWRRSWHCFNPNGSMLLNALKSNKLMKEFNFNGALNFAKMLKDQINGTNDSWAIRWHASVFLQNGLTLYPGKSLVQNIGLDDSGVHCSKTNKFDVNLAITPVLIDDCIVAQSSYAFNQFAEYFRRTRRFRFARLIREAFFSLVRK